MDAPRRGDPRVAPTGGHAGRSVTLRAPGVLGGETLRAQGLPLASPFRLNSPRVRGEKGVACARAYTRADP